MYKRDCYFDGTPPRPVGGLSPIPATDDMTNPVGVRDGQLYTRPTGGVPIYNENDNLKILQIVDGAIVWSDNIPTRADKADRNIIDLQTRVARLEDEYVSLYRELTDLRTKLLDIVEGVGL